MEFDVLSNRVLGCALEVHRELGPGLLKSTYNPCVFFVVFVVRDRPGAWTGQPE